MSVTTALVGRRYVLGDKLGQGGMGSVYQVLDRLTGDRIALKKVTANTSHLNFSSINGGQKIHLALAQEFKILSSLRHPNIINVLDYGFEETDGPFFTMDLLSEAYNIISYSKPLSIDQKIELIGQVLQSLSYLHHRGIFHRDLKPNNVLVTLTGHVKVVDFGIAINANQEVKAKGLAGTIPYMAPETFQGDIHSAASDLYALGIIAFELLLGHHPFLRKNVLTTINAILQTAPDFSGCLLPPELIAVIATLLEKVPGNRYQTANETISALNKATGSSISVETNVTRESFLQAAEFVGREHELSHLINLLNDTHTESKLCLVGGESGIGKSRLLDELRTHALVSNIQVVRGQAIVEGGPPYLIWRDILRQLCLQTTISGFEAGVLKLLITDIETLIEHPVFDVPELPPQAAQDRLFQSVKELITSQKHPILIILEDIHWIDQESLILLQRLSSSIKQQPVLIVASYRNDERIDLPESLSAFDVIQLLPLNHEQIFSLSTSILGARVGQQKDLIDLLVRETEGNVFFVLEVLRSLTQDAGYLYQIGTKTFPRTILSGGMQTLMKRRLQKVPEQALRLLRQAAVIGRNLDFHILHDFSTEQDLASWLTLCANAMIVEVQHNTWRFAHDKIRETILADLSPNESLLLHRQAALAIEGRYPDNAFYYDALVYHWRQAQDQAMEIKYSALAGEQLLKIGGYQASITLLSRAIDLSLTIDIPETQRISLYLFLGEAYYSAGHMVEAQIHLQQALELMDTPAPTSASANKALLEQLVRRIILDRLPRIKVTRKTPSIDKSLLFLRTLERFSQAAYAVGNKVNAVYSLFSALNLSETLGDVAKPIQLRWLAQATVGFGALGYHRFAALYKERTIQLVGSVEDVDSLAFTMENLGCYSTAEALWAEASQYLYRSIDLAKQIGYLRRGVEAMAYLSSLLFHQCRWEELKLVLEQFNSALKQGHDLQALMWCRTNQSLLALLQDEVDRARTFALEATEVVTRVNDMISTAWLYGALVQIYLRQGDFSAAKPIAHHLYELIGQRKSAAFYLTSAYTALIEYFLMSWKVDPAYLHKARITCETFVQFSHCFRIARPAALSHRSWLKFLEHKPGSAIKDAQQAFHAAQELQMPYEEGFAAFVFSQVSPASHPQKTYYEARARDCFERLQIPFSFDLIYQEQSRYESTP